LGFFLGPIGVLIVHKLSPTGARVLYVVCGAIVALAALIYTVKALGIGQPKMPPKLGHYVGKSNKYDVSFYVTESAINDLYISYVTQTLNTMPTPTSLTCSVLLGGITMAKDGSFLASDHEGTMVSGLINGSTAGGHFSNHVPGSGCRSSGGSLYAFVQFDMDWSANWVEPAQILIPTAAPTPTVK
jgi:hypothetical protein